MICADLAGIRVFATGGIGGVHRGAETSFDVSADLQELASTPVAVVCAGATYCLDRLYEGHEALCIHNPATGREATMSHVLRPRSEEHTSELQSLMRKSYAVLCLKKKKQHNHTIEQ